MSRPNAISLVAGLSVALAGLGCRPGTDPGATAAPPVPVVVATARAADVPIEIQAIGNVEAYSTVVVKSRVEGYILEAAWREGQDVRKEDPLFQIDPRPFEAELKKSEANLARDTALAERARAEAERMRRLLESNLSSRDEYDVARANAAVYEAALQADRAIIDEARLELGYATITSPIDGRVGSLKLHEGNLVKANDSALVTILQIEPIRVSFAIPERHLAAVKEALGKTPPEVSAKSDSGRTATGTLEFLDNAVDVATGTIRLKGLFENQERLLWPGQFVEVSLRLGMQRGAVLVPSEAVQTSQAGPFVYLVGADSLARMQIVKTGDRSGGERIILEGVAPGEVVVTDGHVRLTPGRKVEAKRLGEGNEAAKP